MCIKASKRDTGTYPYCPVSEGGEGGRWRGRVVRREGGRKGRRERGRDVMMREKEERREGGREER